jgi:hypothetical protein
VHCHVFTPDSFLGLVEKLVRLGLIDYEVAAFVPTQPNNFEFYVSLRLLDPSTGRASIQQTQLESITMARTRTQSAHPRPSGTQPRLVGMEVSKLEERLLIVKRRTLARLRAMLKRGT